ncbi:MAG: carboxypeptidase regulatory-like domain-containing protein [Bryobacteraceae bacterium]
MRTCLAALLWLAAAQAAEVRGTVKDARGGEPLARVRVQLAGSPYQTVTDAQGRFTLAPAAGEYVLHVSTVGYRLLTAAFTIAEGEAKEFEVSLMPETFRHSESVEVREGPFDLLRQDSPTQLSLSGAEAKNLASVLADDPLRAVQSMPGVTSNDDFDARFSLRGASYDRVGLYLDGVLLHSPFHTVDTGAGTGSLSAFNGDLLEDLDLHTGAFPSRFADRTAGAVEAHTREGSRRAPGFRATASFSNAGLSAEGPLAGGRGSWILSARKSYLQYLIGRTSTDPSIAFGFTDGQGRISYDPAPGHHLSLAFIEGYADLDRSSHQEKLGANSIMTAGHHVTLGNLGWRWTPHQKLMLTNRLAYLRERFETANRQQLALGAGYYGEWVWNSAAAWSWNARAPIEAGFSLRRLRDNGFRNQYQFNPLVVRILDRFGASALRTGGYAQQSWNAWSGRLHGAFGGRWDRHSANAAATVSPQASLGLVLGATRFQFGWGHYAQFPELSVLYSRFGSRALLPERSVHLVAGIEQRIGERTRVRAQFYQRQDRDLLSQPWYEPRILNGRIFNTPAAAPWANSQRGYARGFEIFLQRRSANRLTGWISYAYGRARLRDGLLGIAFPADFDQRHTISVYGSYRVRSSVNVSAKWMYGSGFPIPGFLRQEGARYFLAPERNMLRLGPYHRTDVRVNKSWAYDRWKLTLYGEVVNVANRRNFRFDSFNGYNTRTGQANITLDRMFPVLPSVGLAFER